MEIGVAVIARDMIQKAAPALATAAMKRGCRTISKSGRGGSETTPGSCIGGNGVKARIPAAVRLSTGRTRNDPA